MKSTWHLGQCIVWLATFDSKAVDRAQDGIQRHADDSQGGPARSIVAAVHKALKLPHDSYWQALRDALMASRLVASADGGDIPAREWIRFDLAYPDNGGAPYLIDRRGHRLTGVEILRSDMLREFPPKRVSERTGAVGRPSTMPTIEAELDRWIAGGPAALKANLHGKLPSKANLARALSGWQEKQGYGSLSAGRIETALREKLGTALELL